MMKIEEEIKKIIDKKEGNKEFAIFYNGGEWSFLLGNEYKSVNLGEVGGEIESSGNSLEEAISEMKNKLDIEDKKKDDTDQNSVKTLINDGFMTCKSYFDGYSVEIKVDTLDKAQNLHRQLIKLART